MPLPVIMQELKKIERSLTEISTALHLTHDEENYAVNFLHSLFKLLESYHDGMSMDTFIMNALKTCCDFYKADWCGIIVADATSEIWGPAEWYNAIEGPMSQTHIHENEYFEDFPLWVEALKDDRPIIIPKVEKTVSHRHYLRYQAHNLVGVPFTFRPTGFIILRNAERYLERPEFLKLIVFGGRLIYQTPINIMTAQQRKEVSEVRLNIFGTPSIKIMGKTITAQDYKAPMAWKLLVYLALDRKPHNAYEIAATLLQVDHASSTQADNLRSVIYRMREHLTRQSPQDLIINNNGYILNPVLNITTDAQEMEHLWSLAKESHSTEEKINLLKRASALYSGAVYSLYSHEGWLIDSASYYERLFLTISNALSDALYKEKDYIELQHCSLRGLKIVRENTDLLYWLIISLDKSGNHELAAKKLNEAQDMLSSAEYTEMISRLRKELAK